MALERLSVGYDALVSLVGERLDRFRSGRGAEPLFVRGEWGTGKSHFLAFARLLASQRHVATSGISLNARSAPLNYPQRFYPLLVANLRCDGAERGLRALLPTWLAEPRRRKALFDFSWNAGDLGWRLRALDRLHTQQESLVQDGEWLWNGLLGGDLSWADYPYKRAQALERVKILAMMLRHLGFGGLVATFDETETIDQLWNIRSRLAAYDVLGRLISMRAIWCVFGITDRFVRTVAADLSRGASDWSDASDNAKDFLKSWQRGPFQIVDLPSMDRTLARSLARGGVALYRQAYSVPGVGEDFVNGCIDAWLQNPSRNPRRLIRLVVHRLDVRRPLHAASLRPGADSWPAVDQVPVEDGAMMPNQAQEEFDRLVRAVQDLSGREPNKFQHLKAWLADLLGMPLERVSVKYLGTPNNLRNRLTESSGLEPELTLALTNPGDVATVVRNAGVLCGHDRLKTVAIATKDRDDHWLIAWIVDAPGSGVARAIRRFFPAAKLEGATGGLR